MMRTDRHENGGNLIGESLDGRLGRLGGFHHSHDLRQCRFAADARRPDGQAAIGVDRPPHHFIADIAQHRAAVRR